MTRSAILATAACLATALVSTGATPTVALLSPADMKWEHGNGQGPGPDSSTLRGDEQTGAVEFFAHYPGGHKFQPHGHSVNERIVLLEGRLHVEAGGLKRDPEPGGYAYFPAKEVHNMACVSEGRCAFYL
jgi:quercetin dioxygenase-like cupin family protein